MNEDDCGIYRIRHVDSGKCYIGSSVRMTKRWVQHRHDLLLGKHHSRYMQRAWNKYGSAAFVFEIVEIVASPHDLLIREQHFLDLRYQECGSHEFNASPTAGSVLGIHRTVETRQKLSNMAQGRPSAFRGRQHSLKSRQQQSARKKGRPWTERMRASGEVKIAAMHSPESRIKASATKKSRPPTPAQLAYWESMKGKVPDNIPQGKVNTPEAIAKRAAKLRERNHTDETRERLSQTGKGRTFSEETRAKMSAAAKERVQRGISANQQEALERGYAANRERGRETTMRIIHMIQDIQATQPELSQRAIVLLLEEQLKMHRASIYKIIRPFIADDTLTFTS